MKLNIFYNDKKRIEHKKIQNKVDILKYLQISILNAPHTKIFNDFVENIIYRNNNVLTFNSKKDIKQIIKTLDIKNDKSLFLKEIISQTHAKKCKFLSSMVLTFKLKRNSSRVGFIDRCLFTNRAKIMYKRFKISRIKLKDMISIGAVPGYKKAIW